MLSAHLRHLGLKVSGSGRTKKSAPSGSDDELGGHQMRTPKDAMPAFLGFHNACRPVLHSCHSTVPIQIESSPQSVDSSDDWDNDMCDGGHQFLEQLRQVHESVHIRADDRDAGKVEYEDLCDSKLSGWLAAGLPLVLLQLVARLRWAVLGLPRLHCVE